ncbi:MAG: CBS domain-containing protein [Desulfobulbaceae bacterium]|jgi:tRNA nucleotidyltransferase (CCA-adding enzyme)|nr:CBS domain-containing protein [Desulfobulbaceae bacterium]
MQVITTHINPDFDALASMVAALRLYPQAIAAFPDAPEKEIGDYIARQLEYHIEFRLPKDFDLSQIDTLIVVDTRSSKRLGPFAECLKNPKTRLHLFDHHPHDADMRGEYEEIAETGATATIMVRLLREKGIELTPLEATTICLGIYADTGSLANSSTKPDDLEAAAWLLRQGAQPDVVRSYLKKEWTSEQVDLLHGLRRDARQYSIHNITVTVSFPTLDEYSIGYATIVERLMDMDNLDALFALPIMGDRIYLIARSRLAEVDVGQIARDLGGGGHAVAASATLRDMTVMEAEEELVKSLHRHVHPQPVAAEMMAKPPIVIAASMPIHEAHERMNQCGIAAAPVEIPTPNDRQTGLRLAGIITRLVIERALHHHLGDAPVSDYMTTDAGILSLQATLNDIHHLIIENRQRLVPVVHEGVIEGVITRTDLLNYLAYNPSTFPPGQKRGGAPGASGWNNPGRRRNLATYLVERLSRADIQMLQEIGALADELGCKAFVAGGYVRDLLLRAPSTDIDVVIEGDAIAFAKALAVRKNGRVSVHEHFATADITLEDGQHIDVATARREYYEHPAALPVVEESSIKLDLSRRDFTINAMAIQLNLAHFGELIDFFNCQNDLKRREIKVLHNVSFVDDPSRMFRAIRFEQKLGFTISPHTARLMSGAVKERLFGKGDDVRFFQEMERIFSEENPIPAIKRLAEFGLLQLLWPSLNSVSRDSRFMQVMQQAQRAIAWFRLLYLKDEITPSMLWLLAMMADCRLSELRHFCERFQLPPKISGQLVWQKEHGDKIAYRLRTRQDISNSEAYWLLKELSNEGLLYLLAIGRDGGVLNKAVSNYVTNLRGIKTIMNGDDLLRLGYVAGPLFKKILGDLLDARLNGQVHSRDEELAWLAEHHPLKNLLTKPEQSV